MSKIFKLFFMLTCLSSITCYSHITYANEEEKSIELNLKTFNFFPSNIKNFQSVKNFYPTYFNLIKDQLPENANLLELYIPKSYSQNLEQGEYASINQMVYLYTMPFLLSDEKSTRAQQITRVIQSYKSAFKTFKKIKVDTQTDLIWKQEVAKNYLDAKSIYFTYPETEENKNIFSMLQTFGSEQKNILGAFITTYIFDFDYQIYFLTSTSFVLDNNFEKEYDWTRNVVFELKSQLIDKL